MAYNSAQSINWSESPFPIAGVVDGTDISGKTFSPAELSNFIGSIDAIANTAWASHGGNIELLATPIA